jgi:Arc/MetJ-type ribon-helix-helix transcriptional regulator
VASPITLRLDPELRRRVTRIAKRKRTTTSNVLREAITTWVEREDSNGSFYDSIKDLVGCVSGGDPKLSENTGRKFTELLRARQAKRDSG